MLNEDDLRPGDVIVDAMGDFWHVHDDGKIWCSEPDSRISFEYAKLCGPFTYAPGCDPKRDTVQASEDDSVKHEGKWTRADLPRWDKIRDADDMAGNGLRSRVIDIALNEVVAHLNAHHPKPQPYDQGGVRGADSLLYRAERERDAAVARAEQSERKRAELRRELVAKEDEAISECHRAYRERDEWKARAEAAERELADEYSETNQKAAAWDHIRAHPALRRNLLPDVEGSYADLVFERITRLVEAAATPVGAVHVVWESDLPSARVDGDDYLVEDPKGDYRWPKHGALWWEDRAQDALAKAARFTALARLAAREVDPVEAKARELWEVAKPSANATWSGTNELAKEQFRKVAAHVLGQEARDE